MKQVDLEGVNCKTENKAAAALGTWGGRGGAGRLWAAKPRDGNRKKPSWGLRHQTAAVQFLGSWGANVPWDQATGEA